MQATHDPLIDPKTLAARWGIHPGTLANQRSRGEGVPFVKLSATRVLYRLSDVLAYESARRTIPSRTAAQVTA